MYRATTSFTTKDYDIKYKQILDDNFTTQDEIQEFLNIGYIEAYDGSLKITQNGVYNVQDYDTADVNVSGGGEPNLQSKDVTITVNGTQTIHADTGYDGLSDVDVIVNVSGTNIGFGEIGYDFVPSNIQNAINYSKTIMQNWDNPNTLLSKFSRDKSLVYMPMVDTSNAENFSRCFEYCSNLITVPLLDVSNCTGSKYTFQSCIILRDVPQFDLSNITTMLDMFKNCISLTDESLNNIMASLINATAFMREQEQTYWTLAYIGLSSSQATTCQSLSNWTELSNLGWSTGY